MSQTPGQVIIGRVLKAHGLRGEVKVEVLTELPDRFQDSREVLLDDSKGMRKSARIEKVRSSSNHLLVKFEGVDSPEKADELRGAFIRVSGDTAAPLEDGSFYSNDLVGLTVQSPEGVTVGVIVGIEQYPAQDMLIVDTGESLIMIPAVREYLVSAELSAGRIVLSIPEGLPRHPKARVAK